MKYYMVVGIHNSRLVMDILTMNSNFTVSEDVNGPAIAVVIGVEIILAVTANLYILVYTLCKPKILKQPSSIFLTSLVVINLLLALVFLPFTLISNAAGEWIFGNDLNQKNGVCQFVGFSFAYPIGLTGLHLAVISVDRCLLIVKPLLYKRFMKTWTAIIIVIILWITAVLLSMTPLIGFGRYGFSSSVGTCLPIWVDEVGFVIYFTVIAAILFVVIIVTSVWTFCFTRHFIKRERDNQDNNHVIPEVQHVYQSRIRNLLSIFGLLLLVYVICFSPYFLVSIVGFGVGFGNVPRPIFTTAFIFLLFITSANPLVQVFFRRDMKTVLCNVCKKVNTSIKSVSRSDDHLANTSNRNSNMTIIDE